MYSKGYKEKNLHKCLLTQDLESISPKSVPVAEDFYFSN